MRYSAAEKLEIIRLVEQSALRRTLGRIDIPRATFHRWHDLYRTGGQETLDDRTPRPDRVWNRIPEDIRERIVPPSLVVGGEGTDRRGGDRSAAIRVLQKL